MGFEPTRPYGKLNLSPSIVGPLDAFMMARLDEGDTDRWETKSLVSQPRSSVEIVALLRERIADHTAMSGMYKPVSHMRGAPVLSAASANDTRIRWKFTDDQGHGWSGLGLVEPAPADKNKFIVTLKIARQS